VIQVTQVQQVYKFRRSDDELSDRLDVQVYFSTPAVVKTADIMQINVRKCLKCNISFPFNVYVLGLASL